MPAPFYSGQGAAPPDEPRKLPRSRFEEAVRPKGYLADKGLVDAVNVALLMAQPLLLTGEPGTGKTQLARSVAAELGYGEVLRFDTKSTSTAQDLFYTLDAMSRFHAAQSSDGSSRAVDYVTYNALGEAILRANQLEAAQDLLPDGFGHVGQARRSVVLIDEVDKAPRDFPNDILAELEEMYFLIRELNNAKVQRDEALRPVVIITSNSEKHLPAAFLRRCVYYDVPFPDRDRLAEILNARLGDVASPGSSFVESALDLFALLRSDTTGLQKKPATAELLAWMMAMQGLVPDSTDPLGARQLGFRLKLKNGGFGVPIVGQLRHAGGRRVVDRVFSLNREMNPTVAFRTTPAKPVSSHQARTNGS